MFLWEVCADLNDPCLHSTGYVQSRFPLKIITWLLLSLNTGDAVTQQPGQPALLAHAWHDMERAWNVCRNDTLSNEHLTFLSFESFHAVLLFIYWKWECGEAVRAKQSDLHSSEEESMNSPELSNGPDFWSCYWPDFGAGRMEGNGSGETGWGQCSL